MTMNEKSFWEPSMKCIEIHINGIYLGRVTFHAVTNSARQTNFWESPTWDAAWDILKKDVEKRLTDREQLPVGCMAHGCASPEGKLKNE